MLGGSLSNYCGRERFARWVSQLPRLPLVVVGVETANADTVLVDNRRGVASLVDHLVEGHSRRHLAFIAGPNASQEAALRQAEFRESLRRHGLGLDERYVVPGGLGREQGAGPRSASIPRSSTAKRWSSVGLATFEWGGPPQYYEKLREHLGTALGAPGARRAHAAPELQE